MKFRKNQKQKRKKKKKKMTYGRYGENKKEII